ncbi:hypothetical protein D3C81_970030 [compost metagenome]
MLFLAPFQFELLCSVAPFQADGNQDQRRVSHILRIQRIEPFQGTERQEQDIDALLLLQGTCIEIHVKQALLQPLGSESGLQARIGMPVQNTARVDTVIIGWRQFRDFITVSVSVRIIKVNLACSPPRQKVKWTTFGYHQSKYLARLLINHINGSCSGRGAWNIQQAVTCSQVQQLRTSTL